MTRATYPLDMEPLGLGLGKAEASSVDEEARDAQQLHGCANQAGGDYVVDEESAVVWEENAPAPGTERGETVRGCSARAAGDGQQVLPLAWEVWELPATHWNLTSASSRKWVSKSQRKNRSRLEGREEEQLRKRGSYVRDTQKACAFPGPEQARPSGPYTARAAPSATQGHRGVCACLLDGQDFCRWDYADP